MDKANDDILKQAREAIESRLDKQQGTFTMPMSQDAIAVYALLKIYEKIDSLTLLARIAIALEESNALTRQIIENQQQMQVEGVNLHQKMREDDRAFISEQNSLYRHAMGISQVRVPLVRSEQGLSVEWAGLTDGLEGDHE